MPGHAAGDARSLVAAACAALKIFPLQGVVVFPGTPAPFHVFEPRYRQLVRDALEGDRVIAFPTLAEQGEAELAHEPVRPIAGACVIEDHQELADGRFHLLVRCVARVRLAAELPVRRLYREFRAELLDDVEPAPGGEALAVKAQGLGQLLFHVAAGLPPESGATKLAVHAARLGPSALADLVAAALVSDSEARYAILAEIDIARRLDLVISAAAEVVLAIARPLHSPRA